MSHTPGLLDRLTRWRARLEHYSQDHARQRERLAITCIIAVLVAAGLVELATDRDPVAVALPEPAMPAAAVQAGRPQPPVGPMAALRAER